MGFVQHVLIYLALNSTLIGGSAIPFAHTTPTPVVTNVQQVMTLAEAESVVSSTQLVDDVIDIGPAIMIDEDDITHIAYPDGHEELILPEPEIGPPIVHELFADSIEVNNKDLNGQSPMDYAKQFVKHTGCNNDVFAESASSSITLDQTESCMTITWTCGNDICNQTVIVHY